MNNQMGNQLNNQGQFAQGLVSSFSFSFLFLFLGSDI